MSDLVKNLREWADAVYPTEHITDSHLKEILKAAADEIERLQAERDHMFALAGSVLVGPSYADIAKDARHDLPVSERTDG